MILLITPEEIAIDTQLGGNVDPDRVYPVIQDVQITVIEPLLNCGLYDTICQQFDSGTLTLENEKILNEYILPILKYQVFAEFVEIAQYHVMNGGIYKHAPENGEIVDKAETQYLAQIFRSKSQLYIDRYMKYRGTCDCEGKNRIKTTSGWHV